MRLPNFIGIGVQRAATTWVYQCLKSHPEVFMPDRKELHFFNHDFDKGLEYYAKNFKGSESFVAVGEITPNYINNEFALGRMAKLIPDVKLFLVLREPMSRAYSAYRLLNKQYKYRTFEEACLETDYFVKLSLYSQDIERLLSHFPRNNIKFFLFEDVKDNPKEMLKLLYSFIGVSAEFVPDSIDKIYNPIIYPDLQRTLVASGCGPLIDVLKRTKIGEIAKKFLVSQQKGRGKSQKENRKEDPMSLELRLRLKELFNADIIATQKLITRDLSKWLS